MKRNLLGAGIIVAVWIALFSFLDARRARRRRELWAEATGDNTSR